MKQLSLRLRILWFLALGCLTPAVLQGRHLVGGDITYRCLGKDPLTGNNRYEVTLTVYKDCLPTPQYITNTPFDRNSVIYIYNAQNNAFVTTLDIPLTDSSTLTLTGPSPCIPPPSNLCYAVAHYRSEVVLADNPAGYHLVFGRCCRNETIVNILDPGNAGIAFTGYIPNTALCNNSPEFTNALPTYLCVNQPFAFDHSATDADGDSLVYRLATPFTAGSTLDPTPRPAQPPPYQPVSWQTGYGLNSIMDGSPNLTLDAASGDLSITPNQLGQYVFSILVLEYRNGVLLGETRRDVQINVVECPINYPPALDLPVGTGDTLVVYRGQENCFSIGAADINGPGVGTDTVRISADGPALALGAEFVFTPGLAPAEGSFCWSPACGDAVPDLSPLYLTLRDNNDCPGPNTVPDTLWVRVETRVPDPPFIQCVQTYPDRIELRWSEPLSAAGFLAYEIRRDGVLAATLGNPGQLSWIDRTVTDPLNTAYCYTITLRVACPDTLSSLPSLEVCSASVTPPDLCSVSENPAGAGWSLSWLPNSGASLDRVRIYRQSRGDTRFSAIDELLDPLAVQYTDSTADPDRAPHCYRIGIVDGCGAEVLGDPLCAISLTAEPQDDESVLLTWTPYTGSLLGDVRYDLYRLLPDGTETQIAAGISGLLTYRDADLPATEASVCYRVRSVTGLSCPEDAWSNQACAAFAARVFAPNAFTPNGDGRNDLFTVQGAYFLRYELQIFDRWGSLVFTSFSTDQAWDGSVRGRPAPEGVYMYLLRWADADGASYQRSGSITLVR